MARVSQREPNQEAVGLRRKIATRDNRPELIPRTGRDFAEAAFERFLAGRVSSTPIAIVDHVNAFLTSGIAVVLKQPC
jgi:hypothetical protein